MLSPVLRVKSMHIWRIFIDTRNSDKLKLRIKSFPSWRRDLRNNYLWRAMDSYSGISMFSKPFQKIYS